jgi:hypothetical protein
MESYEGDGVETCDTIVPQIVAISPTIGSIDEPTLVDISFIYTGYMSEYLRTSASCRFGALIIRAENVTNSTMQCRIPHRPPMTVDVRISLNNADWSRENVLFEFKQHFNVFVIMQFMFIYALIVFGVAAGIWKLVSIFKSEGQQEEAKPFLSRATKSQGVGFARKKRIKERFGP